MKTDETDLFGVVACGDMLIATALETMRLSVLAKDRTAAQIAMRALRTVVGARHNWWMRWVTEKNRERMNDQKYSDKRQLRRLQAMVNFAIPPAPQEGKLVAVGEGEGRTYSNPKLT